MVNTRRELTSNYDFLELNYWGHTNGQTHQIRPKWMEKIEEE
jgi:hypothetical protein